MRYAKLGMQDWVVVLVVNGDLDGLVANSGGTASLFIGDDEELGEQILIGEGGLRVLELRCWGRGWGWVRRGWKLEQLVTNRAGTLMKERYS